MTEINKALFKGHAQCHDDFLQRKELETSQYFRFRYKLKRLPPNSLCIIKGGKRVLHALGEVLVFCINHEAM